MVSVETIKEYLGSLIRLADRYADKKLEPKDVQRISRLANDIATLLGTEGFVYDEKKMMAISAHVSRKSIITQEQISVLKYILRRLESE